MPELITQEPESVAVAVVPEIEVGGDLVVAANPGEMQKAQITVVRWADARLQKAREDLEEARECHATAKQAGWNKAPFAKRVRTAELTVNYYEKVVAALEEGYCIVPNFPVTLLAIRTLRDEPTVQMNTPGYDPGLVEEHPDTEASIGEGEYVDPQVRLKEKVWYRDKNPDGTTKRAYWEASEFRDVSMPVKFMRPRVLDATQHAMAQKIFDEVGVMPARKKTDPVVIGRIIGPGNKEMSFLISWFIDRNDL
jgi:hypothetical protein